MLLIESQEKFALKDLFEKEKFKVLYSQVSERTARRDVLFLKANGYLNHSADGTFQLNWGMMA